MTFWDIGGQDKLIELWKHYFRGTDCLIYMFDVSDDEN